MTAEEITQYLTELNDELRQMDIKGEVSLYGGAVMCLAYKARPATKDIDAIFEPIREIRRAAQRISERHHLRKDWLNLAVKIFLAEHKKTVLMDLSNLQVLIPEGDYLFAMKVLAARRETDDLTDIKFLIDRLNITSVDEAVEIVRNYYPKKHVKEATRFFLEELLATK
jgi:hypothetical protein